jgi:hypothetical protein
MRCINPELGKFALLSDREPDERLPESVREHLRVCTECATRRELYDTWLNLLKSESRSDHLKIETLLAYDDGKLTSAEQLKADNHLKGCPKCADTLYQLKSAFDALENDDIDISRGIPGWTTERERAFIEGMKRELAANGQLLTKESVTKAAVKPPIPRPLRPVRALWWGALAFASLILVAAVVVIVGKVFFSPLEPSLSTKETNTANQNLTVQTTSSSPSPIPSATEKDNQTAQQPVRQPSKKATNQSSPEPARQADLDTEEIALAIDPTRTAGERQVISVSKPNLRFVISIPRSAVSRKFQFEMIDEEKGIMVNSSKLITAHPKADHRELKVELLTKQLSSNLYTLRLTGTNKADEVFTLYLKLNK